jgi:hypothetical protein
MQKADLSESEIALKAMKALRKRDFGELAILLPIVASYDAEGQAKFNDALGELAFVDNSFDPAGLAELSAVTMEIMGCNHAH